MSHEIELSQEMVNHLAHSLFLKRALQKFGKFLPTPGAKEIPFADLPHPLVDKLEQARVENRNNIKLSEEEIDYLNQDCLDHIHTAEEDKPIIFRDELPSGEIKETILIVSRILPKEGVIRENVDLFMELNTAWIGAGGIPRPAFLQFQSPLSITD